MSVTGILQQKGSRDVATIHADATLAEAVRLLAHHRIGALVVSTDRARVEGILSERDVVRCMAEHGHGCMAKPVSGVMTVEVATCGMADQALDILRRMTEGRFRHMPVMQNGRLAALVSIGDVVKFRLAQIEMEKAALEDMIKGF